MEDTGLPVIVRDTLVRKQQKKLIVYHLVLHGCLLKARSKKNTLLPRLTAGVAVLSSCLPEPHHHQGGDMICSWCWGLFPSSVM